MVDKETFRQTQKRLVGLQEALANEVADKILDSLKEEFDFVILDAPAGIESGYEHTIEFADKALVVVNPEVSSIRDSDRAIGILDSKSQKVKDGQDVDKFLIINRIDPAMVQSGEMLQSDDILEILSIPLIGKVPEDKGIIDASNQGKPIILDQNSKAGQAYMRIASRLCGNKVDFVDVESENGGLLQKIKGMFS